MTASFQISSPSPEETGATAAALAPLLPDRAVVALVGELGSGKTRFVRGLVEKINGLTPHPVSSPTFTFVNEYQAPGGAIAHMDLYRIDRFEDLINFSPDDYFATSRLTLIEWADRIAGHLPPDALEIRFEITGETSRRITFSSADEELVRRLQRSLKR